MLITKLISSQEKVFLDSRPEDYPELASLTALQGEVVSFQLIHTDLGEEYLPWRPYVSVSLDGELAPFTTLRDVRSVSVDRPCTPGKTDSNYLRTEIGLYPDLLTPLRYGGKLIPSRELLRAVWIEIRIPEDAEGDLSLSLTLSVPDTAVCVTQTLTVTVLPVALPPQKLLFTQWFYPDCLAAYYNVPAWSERHWEIVEHYVALAVKRGRNVMYTPLLTPALNVLEPFERTPCQLLGITVENGEYSFDFSLVDRWIDMCDALGVKFYEISHFYDQYKAIHSAKVYGTVEGEYKQIFGWETLADDEAYVRFLRNMLVAFISHMKARGDDRRCLYHISDEPYIDYLDRYMRIKENIADLLEGYVIMDALSNIEFYRNGAVNTPVPTTKSSKAFIEAGVPNLWVYYACGEVQQYSNCYLAMPSWRTRSLGMQLFKYNIAGFLHWGYNYYNNRASGDAVNPFMELSGEDWVPAGDTFMVYPDSDGTPLESLRMLTMEEAMQDVRAMQLCETWYTHEEIVKAMEDALGDEITFERCAYSADEMLRVREAVNTLIKKGLKQ